MNTVADRQWERFTSTERIARFTVFITVLMAFIVSLRTIEVIPEFLYDAPEQMVDLLNRMWPPDYPYYVKAVHAALIETLHIATLGTLGTLLFAVPVGLLNANNITHNRLVNWFARLILVSSRSVNSLVWALLFVAIFGPGVLAGMMAITFRSIGFVGKLFSEALEELDEGPIEALKATGSPWLSILFKGYWPQVKPAFFAIALFRWDINVRESAVLGLVGAGGIGVVLENELNLFNWERVSVVLISIFAVVIIAEVLVVNLRKKII